MVTKCLIIYYLIIYSIYLPYIIGCIFNASSYANRLYVIFHASYFCLQVVSFANCSKFCTIFHVVTTLFIKSIKQFA